MRVRAAALILAAPACLFWAQAAHADAATKAQEGEITHWIEYYRRERMSDRPARPAREDAQRPPVRQTPPKCEDRECPADPMPRDAVR